MLLYSCSNINLLVSKLFFSIYLLSQRCSYILQFGYAELNLSSSSAQSEMQMNVQDDTAVTNARTNVI